MLGWTSSPLSASTVARKLPNTWRSLRGWQRLSPCRTRKPWVRASVVGDRVPSGGARPACYSIAGDDGAPFICTPRGAPAHEAVRSRASASRGLAELLHHPRCRGDGKAHEGADVQRHAGTRWASRAQARPFWTAEARKARCGPSPIRSSAASPDSGSRFDAANL